MTPSLTIDQRPQAKPKRKGFSASFLFVSIGLHIILGLGATYWIVQQIQTKRKLQFSNGPPTPSPSKRAMEHKVSVQKKKNAGGAPAQAKRIAVSGLAASITLPDMPALPSTSTQFVPGRMSGMGGAGFGTGLGFGSGSGMGAGGFGAGGAGITFFGMRSQTKNVVFVLDASMSTVGGGGKSPKTYRELENEVLKALKALNPASKFNVILYAPRLWNFKETMVPGTPDNLKAAEKFIKEYSVASAKEGTGVTVFREHSGTRMDLAIDKVFELKPDTAIWVSDGMPTHYPGCKGDLITNLLQRIASFQKPTGSSFSSNKKVAVTIHTFAYKFPKPSGAAYDFMRDIAKQNGGTFTEIK